jgi:putative endonuclease
MSKQPCVYILTNQNHTVLYTGVTSDLPKRVIEHRTKHTKGFTAKYNCDTLVYYEVAEDMESAITREKQIKAGSRKKKLELIEKLNREWRDLSDSL